MIEDNSKFDKWNDLKQTINQKKNKFHIRDMEIYFLSIGHNIGFESYGKDELFLRPIVVLKKLTYSTFIGIPLTSKEKTGNFYLKFSYKKDKYSYASLNQLRVFDTKRIAYKSGKMNYNDFIQLQEKVLSLLEITSHSKKSGGCIPLEKQEQRNNVKILPQSNNKVNSVFIIAEAGVNHNGSIKLAKKLIDVAVEAGADAVKFQTFKTENLVSKNAQKAHYQKENMQDSDDNQFNMLKKLELDIGTHHELIHYCNSKNIMFLSTPFDLDSIELLDNLGLEIFKIPSGEITNLPYLRNIGKLNKKIVLSTGMANMDEIQDALNVLTKAGTPKENITILHANTMYPTPMQDVNLKAMITIGSTFNVAFGYSDHTLGIEVDIAAVAMGASVIEKHFTLDNTMEGPDHKASLEPDELISMVKGIRNIELALGSNIKKPSPSETPNIQIARKSIVANQNIQKGDIFTEDNISVKRPANGISPMRWDDIIGSVASKDYSEDELI